MGRKILIRLVIPLAVIVAMFYLVILPKTVSMVTDYPRYTFEFVEENPELLASFHIGDARDPSGFGFPNFSELDYKTLFDGLDLNGWYVPASKEDAQKTLIICHGRTSNRLKVVKYLQIVKDYGLDSMYNVFIPDLRNSGKSQEAKTGMGYEFAEDIAATMRMLQIRKGHSDFVLWGFSMGAMGSATSINRPDLERVLDENGIRVEKLILASPVSNVQKVLRVGAKRMSVPMFMFDMSYKRFSRLSDGFVSQMNLSGLLSDAPPTLILYGSEDSQTPADILEEELKNLPEVRAERFEGAEHVQIYTQPEHKDRYAEAVNQFLRGN